MRSASKLAAAFAVGLLAGGLLAGGLLTALSVDGRGPLTTAAARPSTAPRTTSSTAHPAEVLRVIDGDTFEARVHLWPGIAITTKVRLRSIDAPELRARCRAEHIKAEAARNALKAIIAEGAIGISRVKLDKYGGRTVADALARHTPDISQALLAAGLVRAYSGGRRQGWCGGL